MPVRSFRTENGLKVILHPTGDHGRIHMRMQYSVGEGDVPLGGLAHLTEHMMFEGSRHVSGYDELLNQVGGESNAWTGADQMVFTSTFPAGALDLALFLESDRMAWLCDGLDEADLQNQKSVLSQEVFSELAAPAGTYDDILRSLVFRKHPLGSPVIGDIMSVTDFELDDICEFSEKWLIPSNAALVLAGDIEPDQVQRKVIHWFSDVPSPEVPAKQSWVDVYRSQNPHFFHFGSKQYLYVAWPTVPRGHEDEIAIDFALDLLVHSADGLLNRHGVRADGWVENGRFGGMFALRISGETQSSMKTSVLKQLGALSSLDTDDLEPFFDRIKAVHIRALESLEIRGRILGKCLEAERSHDDANCLREDLKKRLSLNTDDLSRVVTKWLSPERAIYLSVVTDKEEALVNGVEVSAP